MRERWLVVHKYTGQDVAVESSLLVLQVTTAQFELPDQGFGKKIDRGEGAIDVTVRCLSGKDGVQKWSMPKA